MYLPRRASEITPDLSIEADAASLAGFGSAPRRASKSRWATLGARVAPATLSLALVAAAGAFVLDQSDPNDELLAVPDRTDQVSRSEDRESTPSRALVDELSTDTVSTWDTGESAAPVAATWSAQFGAVTGTKYTQSAVKVRSAASGSSSVVAELKTGVAVQVTDLVQDGFRQVVVDNKAGWISGSALGNSAPTASAKSGTTSKTSNATKPSGGTSYSGGSVLGLKPKAMVVYNAVMANFSVPSVGGYRGSSLSSHQCGLAIDFMVYTNASLGNGVADYVIANAASWGVTHIIWRQRIWTPYKPYWRAMADRGGTTANHYDHVHVALADHC